MLSFEFSQNVIPRVINELEEADRSIRIAVFQLHEQQLFEVLTRKLSQGVKVEILTLPYDSINQKVQSQVIQQFQALESNGATLYFCKWNIGDPERTTTAVGRWYSFHGKFIVTDKAAIALSANFTDQHELDAVLIFKGETNRLNEFNKKFEDLLNLFVLPFSGHSGNIHSLIDNSGYVDAKSLFILPKIIESDTHKDHWILDYPSQLCPEHISLIDGLLISPFDIRGRSIIQDVIKNAKSYILLSTESFTDPDIYNDLIMAQLSGVSIKVLTGSTSMDFTDRFQQMVRNMLASGINIYTTSEPLHAKLIITDSIIAVSSINMNKMNLGFARLSSVWRANTETITFSRDVDIITSATGQFENILNHSIDIQIKLAEHIEKDIGNLFTQFYGLRSKREVKKLFSQFFLSEEIEVKKVALKIGKIVKKILSDRTMVQKNDFVKALILYFLSDNKLTYNQLEGKTSVLKIEINLQPLLFELIKQGYIEKEDDYYKLQVLSLF